MLRKFALLLIVAVFALSLCGCSSFIDVRLRLVVHAIGIDPVDEDVYEMSWQVFKAQPPEGGGPVDATGQNIITITTYGRSVYEALKSLERQTGKEVFIGDMELIILGSDFAGKDISGLMSYFYDDCDIYMGMNVVLADGKASEITGMSLEHGTAVAELLNEMVYVCAKESRTIPSKLIDVGSHFKSGNTSFVMPVLSAKPLENSGGGGDDTTVYDKAVGVFKTALISNGTPSGYISPEEAKGICLLVGRAQSVMMVIPQGDELVVAEASITKVKRKATIGENGFPLIKVEIMGELKVKDDPCGKGHKDIKELSQDELFKYCRLAYQKTAAAGTDVLDIERLLKKYENRYYSENSRNIEAIVQNTAFEVNVNLKKYTDDTNRR